MSNKKLLTEYYELCPNGYCEDLLTEQEKKEITEGALYLTGLMQCAGRKNGNGRVYKKDTLKREIDAYKNVVRDRRALGELDHPESSVVNLQNVSHMVVKIDMRGDEVHGKIKVLDTIAREMGDVQTHVHKHMLERAENQDGVNAPPQANTYEEWVEQNRQMEEMMKLQEAKPVEVEVTTEDVS